MSEHIKIGDVSPSIQYIGNGVISQFTYPFPIFEDSDLIIYLGEAKQSRGYTVSGAGDSAGGSVTFVVPPASGVIITLSRLVSEKRTTDFQEGGAFRAKVINEELDRIVCMVQQLRDDLGRAVTLPVTSTASAVLDLPQPVAGKALQWNASADGLQNSEISPDAINEALSSAVAARDAAREARDAAFAVYDGFDDRYLGAKTLPPTTDNDGNPLFGGALYFDETLEIMRVWNGSAWGQAYVQADDIVVTRDHLADGCVNNNKIEPASIEPSALRNTNADKVALRDRFDIPSRLDLKHNQYLQAVTKENYKLKITDFNKLIRAKGIIDVPNHSAIPFPSGFVITFTNQSGTDVKIHRHDGVRIYLAGGDGINKDFRLHNYGMCMLVQTSSNNWFISGAGVE